MPPNHILNTHLQHARPERVAVIHTFHLNRPVYNLVSVGMRRLARAISSAVYSLRTDQSSFGYGSIPRHQLGFARLGSSGIAIAVQTAQGNEIQPQMLRERHHRHRRAIMMCIHVEPSPTRPAQMTIETGIDGGPNLSQLENKPVSSGDALTLGNRRRVVRRTRRSGRTIRHG